MRQKFLPIQCKFFRLVLFRILFIIIIFEKNRVKQFAKDKNEKLEQQIKTVSDMKLKFFKNINAVN